MFKYLLSFLLVLASLLLVSASSSIAENLVKYTNKQGKIFYVTSIEKVPSEYKNQVKELDSKYSISKVESGIDKDRPLSPQPIIKAPISNQARNSKIEIFIASWCGYCRRLEAALNKEGLKYTKFDIETSKEGAKIYEQLGGGGIPITRVNGKSIIRGFSSIDPIKEAIKNN